MKLTRYKLGEILNVTRGASLSGEFYATEGEYIRLTCGNFDYQNNCFKENKSKDNLYYVGDFRSEFLMEEGDIITPLTEQAIGLLGSTAIIPESGKYIQSQDVAKIVCKEDLLDKNFAFYLISSALVKQQLSAAAQQTKIRHTSPDKIKDCTVWIPELSEQKRIGKLLRSIDSKIERNRQINQNLEAMAKQLYDYWFVQFDFPDQNGKPYKSSGRKMVYNPELKREIPEGWGVEKLDDLGTIVGGSTPTKSISDNFTKGGEGYSWITPNDLSNNKGNKFIKNGEIDVTVRGLKDASLKLYPEGTVLMSSRAPVGYLAIATKELTTNQGFKSFIPDKKYDKNYIYYTLQNCLKVIEQNASGSTFKEISATVLKDIKVLQPNLEIVKKFEIKVSSINNYIRDNEVQNQELTQLRDWLLPMLMNGQVKVE